MSTFNEQPVQTGYHSMDAVPGPAVPGPSNAVTATTTKAPVYSQAAQQYAGGIYFEGKTTLPKWQTRLGQCGPPVTTNDWLWSVFCCQCAHAAAKSEMDGSSPCFNCLCFTPVGGYSWIRRAYNLHGTCGDDCCFGLLCAPCSVRQVVNEVRLQSAAGTNPPLLHGGPTDWQESLFGLGCCELCSACICAGKVTNDARRLLQPVDRKLAQDSCCFDCFCIAPSSVYGQVRHTYGIENEFGLVEDLCLPLVCFPCALSRAKREAAWRSEQIRKLRQPQGVTGVAQAVGGFLGRH